LIEPQPQFERLVAMARSLLPPPRLAAQEAAHPEFEEMLVTFPPEQPF
jgi:hypothetical protein